MQLTLTLTIGAKEYTVTRKAPDEYVTASRGSMSAFSALFTPVRELQWELAQQIGRDGRIGEIVVDWGLGEK